jgi:GNAT superfamily N-acetyltransferase
MRHWLRIVSGGRALERDGVLAALSPAAPERAVVNSVIYESADDLAAAYDEIAAAYAEIGAIWTVWVPSHDREAAALLEGAGHFLDAEPVVMSADLTAGSERPAEDALDDWTSDGDPALVGPLNDRAYDFGTDSFTRTFAGIRSDELRVYVARLGGEPAGCLTITDHDRNADVEMVAVAPEARGHGIAGKLLGHALADAAERGLETSTLVATRLGRPVYERLGYRAFATLQMWERRATSARRSPRT